MPTRRAVALALATAPLAVTTKAAPVDPIFAAIDAHRAALAVVHAMEAAGNPDEETFGKFCEAESARLAELLAMTPTTPAGCAAMLRHVEAHACECEEASASQLYSDFPEPISEPAATLLGRLAAVIEQAGA
jgi:hypothetical protein